MTEQEIEEIEMRALAATREPWHVEYFGDGGYPQNGSRTTPAWSCATRTTGAATRRLTRSSLPAPAPMCPL